MSLIVTIGICLAAAAGLVGLTIFIRFYRYRFVSFVRSAPTGDMEPRSPEGYTDKPYYLPGEQIIFFLRSRGSRNTLTIRRMVGPFEYENVYSTAFGAQEQTIPVNCSEQGCSWNPSQTIPIGEDFISGYYQAQLLDEETGATFEIYFIVGQRIPKGIVLVAPVSTWTAYNPWGGKSLYQNKFAKQTVYHVSTQRPNTAFETNHSINVEANIFNWFSKTYPNVSIIPDYLLEQEGILEACDLLVLAYHCEYISKQMHSAVRSIVQRGISLILLGANQLFWVVRWNAGHTVMECHKDVTFFDHSLSYGGMWKHHFRPPQKYLGGRYNGLGMFTFAPYRLVSEKSHWVLDGLDVQPGLLFGMTGIDGKPISGAETDKATQQTGSIDIIAQGLNCASAEIGTIYDASDPRWDGSGGGEMTITYHKNGTAVLNTASIQSGSGLGVDRVFTGIIRNFVDRYVRKR